MPARAIERDRKRASLLSARLHQDQHGNLPCWQYGGDELEFPTWDCSKSTPRPLTGFVFAMYVKIDC